MGPENVEGTQRSIQMDEVLRVFAALPVSAAVIERLLALQRALAQHWPPGAVRWTRPKQLHLTLRFYGNVRSAQAPALIEAVRQACHGTRPLALALAGVGGFPNPRRPRVLWAGLRGDLAQLAQLEQRLAAATSGFGEHGEQREFHPHLTLGRVVDQGRRDATTESPAWLEMGDGVGDAWTATAVHVIRSQLAPSGAHYTELACIPLSETLPPV